MKGFPFYNVLFALGMWFFIALYLVPIFFDARNAATSYGNAARLHEIRAAELEKQIQLLSAHYFMCKSKQKLYFVGDE